MWTVNDGRSRISKAHWSLMFMCAKNKQQAQWALKPLHKSTGFIFEYICLLLWMKLVQGARVKLSQYLFLFDLMLGNGLKRCRNLTSKSHIGHIEVKTSFCERNIHKLIYNPFVHKDFLLQGIKPYRTYMLPSYKSTSRCTERAQRRLLPCPLHKFLHHISCTRSPQTTIWN